jgi:hypothetical protein
MKQFIDMQFSGILSEGIDKKYTKKENLLSRQIKAK